MDRLPTPGSLGFLCGSAGTESACSVGDLGSTPQLGRSPGEGKGYPLQYSGLENSMDCIVHGLQESDITGRLSLSLSTGNSRSVTNNHWNSRSKTKKSKKLLRIILNKILMNVHFCSSLSCNLLRLYLPGSWLYWGFVYYQPVPFVEIQFSSVQSLSHV